MIDQIALDRVTLVRDLISEYEDEIARERTRLDALYVEWANTQRSAIELAEDGEVLRARQARQEARALQHRIEAAEERIDRMEQLLAMFRRKLLEVQRAR